MGEDPGEAGGDEQRVAEIAGKPDLVEDGGHDSVDVDRHRLADGAESSADLERNGGGEMVARDTGVSGDRQEAVEPRVAALVLAMPEAGHPLALRPAVRRRVRRRRRRADVRSNALAASTTAAMACMADSTAAPWNSPSVSSPAAAAACSEAPPEIAVRAARTDGAPAPWSMLATITASMSRAVAGVGQLTGVEQVDDGGNGTEPISSAMS